MQHRISKQIIHIRSDSTSEVHSMQEKLSRLFWQKIVPLLEEVFDRFSEEGIVLKIDRLEIDLGNYAAFEALERNLLEELKRLLEMELAKLIKGSRKTVIQIPVAKNNFEQWLFFLEHGYLPWDITTTVSTWKRDALETLALEADAIQQFRERARKQPLIIERLILQHNHEFLQSIAEVFSSFRQEKLVLALSELRALAGSLDGLQLTNAIDKLKGRKLERYFWSEVFQALILDESRVESTYLIALFLMPAFPEVVLGQIISVVSKREYPVLNEALEKLKQQNEQIYLKAGEAYKEASENILQQQQEEQDRQDEKEGKSEPPSLSSKKEPAEAKQSPPSKKAEPETASNTSKTEEKESPEQLGLPTKLEENVSFDSVDQKDEAIEASEELHKGDSIKANEIISTEKTAVDPGDISDSEMTELEQEGKEDIPPIERKTSASLPDITQKAPLSEKEKEQQKIELKEFNPESGLTEEPLSKQESSSESEKAQQIEAESKREIEKKPSKEKISKMETSETVEDTPKTDSSEYEKEVGENQKKQKISSASTPGSETGKAKPENKEEIESIKPEEKPKKPVVTDQPQEEVAKASEKDISYAESTNIAEKAKEEKKDQISKSEIELSASDHSIEGKEIKAVEKDNREEDEDYQDAEQRRQNIEATPDQPEVKRSLSKEEELSRKTRSEKEKDEDNPDFIAGEEVESSHKQQSLNPEDSREENFETKTSFSNQDKKSGTDFPPEKYTEFDEKAEEEKPEERIISEEDMATAPEGDGDEITSTDEVSLPGSDREGQPDLISSKKGAPEIIQDEKRENPAPENEPVITSKKEKVEESGTEELKIKSDQNIQKDTEEEDKKLKEDFPVEAEASVSESDETEEHASEFEAAQQSAKKTKLPGTPPVFYKPPVGSEFFIHNAGIVLIHPFLSTYFKNLELLDKSQFIDEETRQKAIHLLHYLSTRETETPEYNLVLPKVLCGLPINIPVDHAIEITEEEQEEGEALLQAAIDYWTALKNTSPDGLRGTFLQRDGKLVLKQGGWVLIVEQQTPDILLDQLPWGIGIVKLPWMPEMLKVEWR